MDKMNKLRRAARTANEKLERIGLSLPFLAAFLVLGFLPLYAGNEYTIRLGVTCVLYGTLAMGFDLSAGYIDVANWGYGALMGVGGYVSALLEMYFGVSPWLGLLLGALAAALLGLFIGVLTLRMNGMFAALLAWFVGMVIQNTVSGLSDITRGAKGLQVCGLFDTPWSTPYFYVIFVIALLTFIALRLMVRSHLGLAFRALGQDSQAAQSSGVNPLKYRLINFCTSCFIAGLCGAFYGHFVGILTPSIMSAKTTITILVIAYFGGRASIWGPLLASFIINPVFESMSGMMEMRYIIYGLILILVMLFMPKGLSGLLDSARQWLGEAYMRRQEKRG